MSVSSISSSATTSIGLSQTDWRSTVKQGKQDFSQLLSALQSGDVSGAQQAYAAMQQLLPGFQASANSTDASAASSTTSTAAASTTSGNISAGTVGTDFSALGTALNSGSLSGAQEAVAKLQKDALAFRQEHHKFGNLEHAKNVYNSMQASTSTNSSNATSSASSLNADLTALGQALQSGSMSSAQDAFAKLQQDLQSTQQSQGHRHHHHAAATQNPMSSYIANSVLGSAASTANSSGSAVKVAV